MLQRAEHDMLALYDANDTSPDPAYRKYRAQMERFLTSVGCKLGWDHTPYEMVDPQGVFNEAFYESIVKAIISVSNRRFPVDHREIHQFESRIRFDTEILTLICVLFESCHILLFSHSYTLYNCNTTPSLRSSARQVFVA
jgi:hypothetical protein